MLAQAAGIVSPLAGMVSPSATVGEVVTQTPSTLDRWGRRPRLPLRQMYPLVIDMEAVARSPVEYVVVGRLLSPFHVNPHAIVDELRAIAWKNQGVVTIEEVASDDGRFILNFVAEGDRRFVLKAQPWHYRRGRCHFAEFDGKGDLQGSHLGAMAIWAQGQGASKRALKFGSFSCAEKLPNAGISSNNTDGTVVKVATPVSGLGGEKDAATAKMAFDDGGGKCVCNGDVRCGGGGGYSTGYSHAWPGWSGLGGLSLPTGGVVLGQVDRQMVQVAPAGLGQEVQGLVDTSFPGYQEDMGKLQPVQVPKAAVESSKQLLFQPGILEALSGVVLRDLLLVGMILLWRMLYGDVTVSSKRVCKGRVEVVQDVEGVVSHVAKEIDEEDEEYVQKGQNLLEKRRESMAHGLEEEDRPTNENPGMELRGMLSNNPGMELSTASLRLRRAGNQTIRHPGSNGILPSRLRKFVQSIRKVIHPSISVHAKFQNSDV
ncbi:hypothetical protein ZWY2020_054721 [Hordeum vulgare]|nr:hypothetical protein ZWY2020_054721 [Hordeum vulgare]